MIRLPSLLALLLLSASPADASFFRLRYLRAADGPKLMGGAKPSYGSDEQAARAYLQAVFEENKEKNPTLMGPVGAGPEVKLVRTIETKATNSKVLRFEQTYRDTPVFATLAAVELDADRGLISMSAVLGSLEGAPAEPKLTAGEAVRALLDKSLVAEEFKALLGMEHAKELLDALPEGVQRPRLTYFRKDGKAWRLAYRIDNFPATPKSYDPSKKIAGVKAPLRALPRRFNYLVDAEDGSVLLAYSASPLAKPEPIIPPTISQGRDDFGVLREFHVRDAGDGFVLDDTLRRIQTYDMGFRHPYTMQGQLVKDPAAAWGQRYAAAVSAHANATKIFDFYNDLLKRKGIVDDRSSLVSYVNCTSPMQKAPVWHNAQWTGEHMLYGQGLDSSGTLRSLARYSDVVGHELTHGVVEHTAELVYLDMPGALNESVADIMGVLAKNWDPKRPDHDASGFNWEVGEGIGELLGEAGPLRDMANPGRTGLPAHMKDYRRLPAEMDFGGVHVNSGIHNKAAYNLVNARGSDGKYIIHWKEAALLYYVALTRLAPMSGFPEMREALTQAASARYALQPATRDRSLKAIADAYDAVGIPLPPQ